MVLPNSRQRFMHKRVIQWSLQEYFIPFKLTQKKITYWKSCRLGKHLSWRKKKLLGLIREPPLSLAHIDNTLGWRPWGLFYLGFITSQRWNQCPNTNMHSCVSSNPSLLSRDFKAVPHIHLKWMIKRVASPLAKLSYQTPCVCLWASHSSLWLLIVA